MSEAKLPPDPGLPDIAVLAEALGRGDRRALALLIKLVESSRRDYRSLADHLLKILLPRTGELWTTSLAVSYHEGWPTTSLSLANENLVAGPYNAQRLADFQSIDVRVSRRIALARSELTVFGELINALNHSNPCCLAYDLSTDEADQLTLETNFDEWLPLVPSVGVTWRF